MEPVLAMFVAALVFFHFSEAALIALLDRPNLSFDSLLFSRRYCIAMGCAVLEHLLEARLLPSLAQQPVVSALGVALVVGGEFIRKTAILTARHNFTHRVAQTRRETHRLVTHGIYAVCRHPGYLGWFLWCLGTQLLLVNPLCLLVFAVLAARFFTARVALEERHLARMFPADYPRYRATVRSCLPFVGTRG